MIAVQTGDANVAAVVNADEAGKDHSFRLCGKCWQEPDGRGIFSKYAPRGYRAISAGTKPAGEINQLAVQAMNEIGIDITGQKSKVITDDMITNSAKAVNMGCMDRTECPLLFLNNPINWVIEDTKGKYIKKVREMRDEI